MITCLFHAWYMEVCREQCCHTLVENKSIQSDYKCVQHFEPFYKKLILFFLKSETPRMLNLLKTILKQINSIYKSIPNNK